MQMCAKCTCEYQSTGQGCGDVNEILDMNHWIQL